MASKSKLVASTEFKIEKGMPLPLPGRHPKWPWRQLEVGDSFFMPGAHTGTACRMAGQQALRLEVKFSCRTVSGGVRIWRIA